MDSQIHLLKFLLKEKRLHIHFDNQGNEIKEKHWERIFQRFYRVDKSAIEKQEELDWDLQL